MFVIMTFNLLFSQHYRQFHSCETAVLRVSNDICVSLDTADEHDDVILILLDFSSAFDTLKHDILLHRLKGRFGIKGLWFETYLKNRQHKVVVNGVESPVHTPDIGVPQGSV